jgi:hypothetical protein
MAEHKTPESNKSDIQNHAIDSASIEVNRRHRRAKTDRLDVHKLLTMLLRHHAGEQKVWSVVQVPSMGSCTPPLRIM